MPRTYRAEFPEDYAPPAELLTWLAGQKDFKDSSWGNDVCPSFEAHLPEIADCTAVRLWCDHPDDAQREFPGSKRFRIAVYPDETATDEVIEVCATDDAQMAIDVAQWTVRMTHTVFHDTLKLLATGELPKTMTGFPDAHLHFDANVFGDFEEGAEFFSSKYRHLLNETRGHEFEACRDVFFGIVNAVQNLMDWWIKNRMKGEPDGHRPPQ